MKDEREGKKRDDDRPQIWGAGRVVKEVIRGLRFGEDYG